MRVPSLILLSSVALTLLVRAEDVNVAASASTTSVSADAAKISENIAAALPIEAAAAAVVSAGEKAAAAVVAPEAEKTYPVGNGIVYTKSSFFGDNKDMKTTSGLQAKINAMSFVANMLGINLGIGTGGSDDKDGDGDKDESIDPWYLIPLYGDDGYEKRPVPSGCAALTFKDQMACVYESIWDQQGNSGEVVLNQSKSPKSDKTPTNDKASVKDKASEESNPSESVSTPEEVKGEDVAKVNPKTVKRSEVPSEVETKQIDDKKPAKKDEVVSVKDVKVKAAVDSTVEAINGKDENSTSNEDSKGESEEDEDEDEDDENEASGSDAKSVPSSDEKSIPSSDEKSIPSSDEKPDILKKFTATAEGIRICLLGGCDSDGKPRHKIHHKQKKFLKQFRGKALKIDGSTGCPIPSK
ncbi:hypothetical protein BGZ76_003869 [Entomortierella beljakovae]|nr:hypothetical protein BGZ76_003869 [Entomortierella beljakovae]